MGIRLRCRRGVGVHWRAQVTEARHGDHPNALVIATTAAMNGQQREPDPASWYSIGPQRVVTNWLPCATRRLARLMSLSKRHPSSIVAATRSRSSHPCRIGSRDTSCCTMPPMAAGTSNRRGMPKAANPCAAPRRTKHGGYAFNPTPQPHHQYCDATEKPLLSARKVREPSDSCPP